MRIQHNIAAMSSYRNYTNNVSALNKNLEKLSSGYKINRAGDDAAGLAISEKMRAQISGLEAAQKNAKDGISLVQTAEGALTEVHDMLNRMVTLATQSANGTYDNETDRYQLQKEMDQLRSEIDRIADSSNFNGIKLLDGSMDTTVKTTGETDLIKTKTNIVKDGQLGKTAQAGIFTIDLSKTRIGNTNKDDTVIDDLAFNIFGQDLDLGTSGGLKIAAGDDVGGDVLAEAIAKAWNTDVHSDASITFGGVQMTAKAEGTTVTFTMDQIPTSAWGTSNATKGVFSSAAAAGPTAATPTIWYNGGEEVTVTAEQEPVDSTNQRMYAQAKFKLTDIGIADGKTLKIGDTTYTFAVGSKSKYKDLENVVDLTDMEQSGIAKKYDVIGMRLSEAAKDNRNFKVGTDAVNGTGAYITVTEKEGGVDYSKNNLAGDDGLGGEDGAMYSGTKNKLATVDDWAGLIMTGKVNSSAMGTGLTLQIGDTADSFNQLKVSVKDCHTSALGINKISIADQESAASAVDAIKSAINYISDVRGTLGATQNRLDHTINNLSVMTENIQDAESTIRDTDIAEEMMSYTKNNILVQSAQAMLAQANQIPQGVLQLLG